MELCAITRRGFFIGANHAVRSSPHVFDVLWQCGFQHGGIASSGKGARKSCRRRSRRGRILRPGTNVADVAASSTGGQICTAGAGIFSVPDDGSAASRAVPAGACRRSQPADLCVWRKGTADDNHKGSVGPKFPTNSAAPDVEGCNGAEFGCCITIP